MSKIKQKAEVIQEFLPDTTLELWGFIFAFIATIGIGMQSVVVKLSYEESIGMAALLVIRKLMFLPFYSIYLFKKYRLTFLFDSPRWIGLAMFNGVLGHYLLPVCVFYALETIEAGVVTVILFTYPLFVIVIDACMRRYIPSFPQLLAFACIQLGVYLVMGGNMTAFSENLNGALYTLLAALAFGVFTIIMQRLAVRMGARKYMFHALNGGLIAALLHLFLISGVDELILSSYGYLLMAIFSIVCFVPAILMAESMMRIGAVRASLVNGMSPFVTIIFAYLLVGEVLSTIQIAGGVIVVVAVLILEKNILKLFIPHFKQGTMPTFGKDK
jgi:drug/metabolite transporter (DMT)-like permease